MTLKKPLQNNLHSKYWVESSMIPEFRNRSGFRNKIRIRSGIPERFRIWSGNPDLFRIWPQILSWYKIGTFFLHILHKTSKLALYSIIHCNFLEVLYIALLYFTWYPEGLVILWHCINLSTVFIRKVFYTVFIRKVFYYKKYFLHLAQHT